MNFQLGMIAIYIMNVRSHMIKHCDLDFRHSYNPYAKHQVALYWIACTDNNSQIRIACNFLIQDVLLCSCHTTGFQGLLYSWKTHNNIVKHPGNWAEDISVRLVFSSVRFSSRWGNRKWKIYLHPCSQINRHHENAGWELWATGRRKQGTVKLHW